MSITRGRVNPAPRVITPFLPSRTLSQMSGAEVFVKSENHQFTASFKDRGAVVKIASLGDEERSHGVIAMSAGHPPMPLPVMPSAGGMPATIVMPPARRL